MRLHEPGMERECICGRSCPMTHKAWSNSTKVFRHRRSTDAIFTDIRSSRRSRWNKLTHVDYVDRMALVVEDCDRLVAVCRYERLPDTTEAEIAFVVADNYQHHGIGALLLERLVGAARPRGIRRFVAYTLSENRVMQQVFTDSGFRISTSRDAETMTIRFPIEPDSSYRTSRKAHLARMRARLRAPDDVKGAMSTETEFTPSAEAQLASFGAKR
jgi:GNAT superfamily N-acetyltransferase